MDGGEVADGGQWVKAKEGGLLLLLLLPLSLLAPPPPSPSSLPLINPTLLCPGSWSKAGRATSCPAFPSVPTLAYWRNHQN